MCVLWRWTCYNLPHLAFMCTFMLSCAQTSHISCLQHARLCVRTHIVAGLPHGHVGESALTMLRVVICEQLRYTAAQPQCVCALVVVMRTVVIDVGFRRT